MKKAQGIDENTPPRLFVRMKDSSGNTVCLMPMGIAITGAGQGKCSITQFSDAAKVGNWRVEADADDVADQFEGAADALRAQMLFESAKPPSVEKLLRGLMGRTLEELKESVAASVEEMVGPEVERKLTHLAEGAETPETPKARKGKGRT